MERSSRLWEKISTRICADVNTNGPVCREKISMDADNSYLKCMSNLLHTKPINNSFDKKKVGIVDLSFYTTTIDYYNTFSQNPIINEYNEVLTCFQFPYLLGVGCPGTFCSIESRRIIKAFRSLLAVLAVFLFSRSLNSPEFFRSFYSDISSLLKSIEI